MKKTVLLVFILMCALFLSSCAIGETIDKPDGDSTGQTPENPEENPDDPENTQQPSKDIYYRVMVTLGEGFTVISDNPVEVLKGEDAVFDINIAPTHAFVSVSAGEYDQTLGKLTVRNVTKKTTVNFKVEYES